MTVTTYLRPRSLPEAIELLGQHGPEALVVAGGTVAMPLINEGISLPAVVIGLRAAGLDRLETSPDALRIGATTTVTALLHQDAVPILREAARETASWAVRNMATVGGNLFTPPPGGDVAVALLALDATVRLVGPAGERTIPLADFFTGFMTTAMRPDELLAGITVPRTDDPTAFLKFGRKHANTPAVVTVAARIAWADDGIAAARIALSAVGPHPIRVHAAERLLVGTNLEPEVIKAAAAAAAATCDPATDAIATDWYRRRMTGVMVARALSRIAGRVPTDGGRDA
jgi:carbon-monoxide dehydrogenase medium subunit